MSRSPGRGPEQISTRDHSVSTTSQAVACGVVLPFVGHTGSVAGSSSNLGSVLLVRRAPSDHPSDEVVLAAFPDRTVRFLDWDWETSDGPRARRIVVKRPGAGREPIGVMLPRPSFVVALMRAGDDVVIVRDVGVLVALASLGRLVHRRRRVVCLVEHHPRHSGPAVDVRWKRPFRRLFSRGIAAFVANTPEAADWLRVGLGVPDRVITEGWWQAGFPPELLVATDTAPPSIQGGEGPMRLGFVGALNERKRPDIVVETVARLRESGHDVQAWIIGDGPLAPRLVDQVRRHRLGDTVTLTGPLGRAEVAALIASFDLLLAPSVEDQTCRAVIEAIGLGVPVVASAAIGSVGPLVRDGENGVVLTELEPKVWAAAIAAITPDLLATLRAGAERSAPVVSTAAGAAVVARAVAGIDR